MRRLVSLGLLLLPACSKPDAAPGGDGNARSANRTVFTAPIEFRAPSFTPVNLPEIRGGAAVWGGTGRDGRGRVYFGLCCEGVTEPSAHLIELDPQTGTTTDRGGVMENLRRLGLGRPGEGQQKIHTKIVSAADGYLYFASMDEQGESEDGSRLPTHGSHLWRVKADGGEWEHLAAVREAVIAGADGGPFVYYLAYFGHVLYQYDTGTAKLRRVTVGSHGGHVSRNFLADDRGHAFVPRVSAAGAELVEFDPGLAEVGRTPLAEYSTTPDASSHGISSFAELKDGGRAFVTDRGRVYRIDGGSGVTDLGGILTGGPIYVPCLFSPDGATQLVGLGYRSATERKYEWVVFDLMTRTGRSVPVSPPVPAIGWHDLLLYGSVTRDDAGRFYVAGRYMADRKRSVPVAWAVTP